MDLATREILRRRYVRAVLRAAGLDVSRVSWPDGAIDTLWALKASAEVPDFPEFCEFAGYPLDEGKPQALNDTQILRGL